MIQLLVQKVLYVVEERRIEIEIEACDHFEAWVLLGLKYELSEYQKRSVLEYISVHELLLDRSSLDRLCNIDRQAAILQVRWVPKCFLLYFPEARET